MRRTFNARFVLRSSVAAILAITSFAASAQDTGPIRIAVVTPLSGTYASIGQQVGWGIELATREINDAGGVMGRKLELLFEDAAASRR